MLLSRATTLLTLALPLVIAQNADVDSDIALVTSRRIADLAQVPTPAWIASIPTWLEDQSEDGTWKDVNYKTGCDAQRANWPIQQHWNRLITFAAAWTGVNPAVPTNYTNSPILLGAVSRGLDYWFINDFTSDDCIGLGGKDNATCPCGTPGLWNTNWFGQVILIPQLCSTTCLLVSSANLSTSQRDGCERIPKRAYDRRDQFINGLGYLTGANTINVMQNSVSMGLYTNNQSVLEDSFQRAMGVVTLESVPQADGIHADGSFLQHNGILYNGNYGKDLLNAFIQLQGEAIGTSFSANSSAKQAFAAQVKGSEWMIYVDGETGVEHWDFNTIGRFVAFPTADLQASADINFNVSKLAAATADFTGDDDLSATIRRLRSNGTDQLLGNKGFWSGDYMIHRRDGVVLTNKMISNRSVNTEFTNSANPYGYHLGQGTLYSYVTGGEYKDIMGAWNWNLVPGTTTLLNHPHLNSSVVGVEGLRDFVGVVSDGWVGTSVEDYVDPHDQSLSYRKAWFFLDDSVVVITTDIKLNSSTSSFQGVPVVTVLDQRVAATDRVIMVDGMEVASDLDPINGTTLFYGGNGYMSFDQPFNLTLSQGPRTGNWSAISTSAAGNQTVDIFSAYTSHEADRESSAYVLFPASSPERLTQEAEQPSSVPLVHTGITGVAGQQRLSLVFWPESTGSIGDDSVTVALSTIGWADRGNVTITSDQPAAYLFATRTNDDESRTMVITISDPSQRLDKVSLTLSGLGAKCPMANDDGCEELDELTLRLQIKLPQGGMAGSSTFREVLVV